MIQDAAQEQRAFPVFKLVALPAQRIEEILLRRGIEAESIEEAKEALVAIGMVLSPQDAVALAFTPRDGDLPFSVGRFGDGRFPVFYSAIEEETCIEEVMYHQGRAVRSLPHARYFDVVRCDYGGMTMILRGHEQHYPDLISPTEAGYPFCRAVAAWTKGQGAQALYTTSARRHEGTCVPVFVRQCLANEDRGARYRFSHSAQGVAHDRIVG